MRSLAYAICATLLFAVMCASPVSAFLASPLNLKHHAGSADLIVAGEVVSRTYEPDETKKNSRKDYAAPHRAVIAVERVVKGVLPGDVKTITVDYTDHVFYPRQFTHGFNLFLLKRQGDSITFSRDALSLMRIARNHNIPYTPLEDARAGLEWEMLNSLLDSDPTVVYAAYGQVSLLTQDEVIQHVKPRIKDPDQRIRNLALATCLAAGDRSLIPMATEIVSKIAKTDHIYYNSVLRYQLRKLVPEKASAATAAPN